MYLTLSPMLNPRLAVGLLAATISGPLLAAQQSSTSRAGWPCGGRLDPAYFAAAEATGGQLLLLAPEEVADSAALLIASGEHPQSLFRLAGAMNPGVHEFRVPVDASLESAVFSISVQCLQNAEVLRPSGGPVGGEGVTDYSNFRAQRMVVVKRPEPGIWTIRAAGNGVAGVMVKALGGPAITGVQFAAAGTTSFTPIPLTGVDNVVRLTITGSVSQVEASLVDAAFRKIASLPLTADDNAGYSSRFTPKAGAFRVLIEGRDASGAPFQRLHAPLFTLR